MEGSENLPMKVDGEEQVIDVNEMFKVVARKNLDGFERS
jgi:hypothetical protein